MYTGRILEESPASEIYADPKHPYTQDLLAACRGLRGESRLMLLRVKDLVKHFPVKAGGFSFSREKVHALNDVSLSIAEETTMGLVGESGCGKTTMARSILRVIEPTEGRLYFDRSEEAIEKLEILEAQAARQREHPKRAREMVKEVARLRKETDFFSYPKAFLKEERLKMQYVFQDPYLSLNPKMQIRSIITEALIEHKKIDRRERDAVARRYLDIVGLPSNAISKYPHEFSGGQRQRINIARAIATNPKFIVCDEPVSSLDVSIQSQILNLLIEIQREMKSSYLFIGHNLNVVFYISDFVAVMYTGKIVELASSKELFHNPKHPYTELLRSVAPEFDRQERAENGIGAPSTSPMNRGEVPSLIDLPRGCTFYSRCPLRGDMCRTEFPPLREISPGHFCACYMV